MLKESKPRAGRLAISRKEEEIDKVCRKKREDLHRGLRKPTRKTDNKQRVLLVDSTSPL